MGQPVSVSLARPRVTKALLNDGQNFRPSSAWVRYLGILRPRSAKRRRSWTVELAHWFSTSSSSSRIRVPANNNRSYFRQSRRRCTCSDTRPRPSPSTSFPVLDRPCQAPCWMMKSPTSRTPALIVCGKDSARWPSSARMTRRTEQ